MILQSILQLLFTLVLLPLKFFLVSATRTKNKVFYGSWGRNRIDTAPAQPRLERKGMPTPPIAYSTLGGGLYGAHGGRLITEMTAHGGGDVSVEGTQQINAGGGGGFMNVGYLLKRGRYFRLYPLIGIGAGAAGALIAESDSDKSVGVGGGGPILNFGLGLELKLGRRLGVMAGLRIGLLVTPYEIAGGTRTITPYAHFIGGLGSFDRREKRHPKQLPKAMKMNEVEG